MKWIHILLVLALLMCGSGIASAANGTLTLFTDEHIANAEDTVANSDIGDLFALLSIIVIIVIWLGPVALLLTAIVAKMMHKNDLYKDALVGFAMMVVVLVIYNLYVAFIGSMAPDISSIQV